MSIVDMVSLFSIMLVLALLPSTSVAVVVTRSITNGTANGIAVSLGIVLGDLVFILLVILGLAAVAQTMGVLFLVIKYMGGFYLIWLGISLLVSKNTLPISTSQGKEKANLFGSFMAGFLITLGDIKAIFFYISLLPTFVDMQSLKWIDTVLIMLITIITVGGVKIFYAVFAAKVISLTKAFNPENKLKKIAGSFMIGAGGYLIVKA